MAQTSFFDFSQNPFFDPKNNPFLDPAKNPFLNKDLAEVFSNLQAPLDFQDVVASQRKNMEAIAAANKTAVEGMQAIIKRQSEILKEIVDETNALAQEAKDSVTAAPDEQAAKNLDTVKGAIEEAVSNMKELSEMLAKSQGEAFDILNARLSESLDEVKSTIAKAKK